MIVDMQGNRKITSSDVNGSLIELLKNYMEEYNISQKNLADILSINLNSLRLLLDGSTTEIKLNHAMKIGSLIGVSESDLLSFCMKDFSEEEVKNIDKAKKISFIFENFDLESLKAHKLIKSVKDFDDIEMRICNFFGFDNIFDYQRLEVGKSLFSKSNMSAAEKKRRKMLDFWLRCNKYTFENISNPNEYNRELLIDYMTRIKFFSKNIERGFFTVVHALYKIGVTVTVQPYLKCTGVFGSTMIVNNKPCIVLTNLYKRYDILWHTLVHELYHVLEDYDYLEKVNYHITDEEFPDLLVSEEDANSFAAELLFGADKLRAINPIINNHLKVDIAARRTNIHTSIIYGQYLHSLSKPRQRTLYPKFQKYLISSDKALKTLLYRPLEYNSILDAVKQVKEMYSVRQIS